MYPTGMYEHVTKGTACSVIQGPYSYGGDEVRLEIMGLLTTHEQELDGVSGYLTLDDVYGRILEHWTTSSRQ